MSILIYRASGRTQLLIPFERSAELGNKQYYFEEEAEALRSEAQEKAEIASLPSDPNRGPPLVGDTTADSLTLYLKSRLIMGGLQVFLSFPVTHKKPAP